ncbi:MAG TPA: pyridoxamine 5'-phosphate oxidase [Mycobacteriales bacterium]|nr:pyridoxamine 5'-phosphate oxidase [Mycobacteriales bacterium]
MPHPSAAELCRRYAAAGLAEPDLAATWVAQLQDWLAQAEEAQLTQPGAMTLATVDGQGQPTARTVLLKGLDDRGLIFFTNRTSRKAAALAAVPAAGLVLPWVPLERQVCIAGQVEQVTRAETEAYARSRPRGSQIGAWASHQSQVISGRSVLEQRREELERRFAGAPVPVPPFWGGYRVLPLTVEFWQGRPDRLHDRLRFRRRDGRPGAASDAGWVIERLAP